VRRDISRQRRRGARLLETLRRQPVPQMRRVDSADEAPDCSRPCVDSPYHRCGGYVAVAESLSCSALAVGIAMDDWSAYSVEVDGLPIDVVRRDGVLTGTCDGSALVRRWSVSDEPGCALVESVPQSCEALSAGLLWDRDCCGIEMSLAGRSRPSLLTVMCWWLMRTPVRRDCMAAVQLARRWRGSLACCLIWGW
jgi:hypothetical protein